MKVKRFVKEFKPIEIKEPFKPDVLEFKDPNDFNRYYREHEDEFENISTYKLNIKYKIPGYRISQKGKKNNDLTHSPEIILIKDYRLTSTNEHPDNLPNNVQMMDLTNIQKAIDELTSRISNIENYLSSDS